MSATDLAAIDPHGIKTLLANCLIILFINGKLSLMVAEVYQEIQLINLLQQFLCLINLY